MTDEDAMRAFVSRQWSEDWNSAEDSIYDAEEVERMSLFRKQVEDAINAYSMESGSDTPDFILAGFLTDALHAFDKATKARSAWHGTPTTRAEGSDVAFNELEYEGGQYLRITLEAELLRTEKASGNFGTARLLLRAGRGMNDGVWLVREPGYGRVVSVEVIPRAG